MKHHYASKTRLNLLKNIKQNGRAYPLESNVYNHTQDHKDLMECSAHIQCAVPVQEQKVEHLIDSIICTDSTLHADIGLVRASTNNLREYFEAASSSLIEVDPYHLTSRDIGRNPDFSSIEFKSVRGSSVVDLRWHPK